MGKHDLFIYDDKLDTPTSRKFFDFNPEPVTQNITQILSPRHQFLLDVLGIDPSLYEVEMIFDQDAFERRIRVKLSQDILLRFELENNEKFVELNKNDVILLVRITHNSAQDAYRLLDDTDFNVLHASHTPDAQYILTISRIKHA
jgi:hypothetical protein